jgi:hypothetical protein
MPYERTHAVLSMEDAVKSLVPYMHCEGEFVRVPRSSLEYLGRCLRHYPTSYELDMVARKCPEIFAPTQ